MSGSYVALRILQDRYGTGVAVGVSLFILGICAAVAAIFLIWG